MFSLGGGGAFKPGRKNSLKIRFLGRIFLGHQGPSCRDIPDPGPGMSQTKTLCKAPFLLF